MKSVDAAFRNMRLFMLLIIVCYTGLMAYMLHRSFQIAAVSQSRMYVLAGSKVLEAVAADRKDNIPVEARDHVSTFHHFFFTLDPDEKVIEQNITKALYLADASARQQYEALKESGYYTNIISSNISQEITVDSVELNLNQYPYYFRCSATQKIIRTSSTALRTLLTEGFLRSVSRSDHNSHGFLIERWRVLENKDIKTINR
jgi:conjugative transposon TraK protein